MSILTTCIDACLSNKKLVFFGAGHFSLSVVKCLGGRISYFCDNAPVKQGTEFLGIPVYPPSKLQDEDRENTVVIINTEYYGEIAGQLIEMGFRHIYCAVYKNGDEPVPVSQAKAEGFLRRKAAAITQEDAAWLRGLLSDDLSKDTLDKLIVKYKSGSLDFSDICAAGPIYFNEIPGETGADEVYVDAGAFDGKTAVDFILFAKGKYRKIYAFEPDIVNFISMRRDLSGCRDIVFVNAALGSQNGRVCFDMRGTESSKIAESGGAESGGHGESVEAVTLDSFVKEPVTFIKMDIEGGEYDALTGARETISRHKPRLAISVYHKDEDLIRIPRLIHGMVPGYRFYLRHHTRINTDTVLYAVI